MVLIPGAGEALGEIRRMGWQMVVITNQSGIGRGYFTLEDVNRVHERLDQLLAEFGAKIDKYYLATEAPDQGGNNRKPKTGLAELASREFDVDLKTAVVVGDRDCDIELGRRIGAKTVLVMTGDGHTCTTPSDHVIASLADLPEVLRAL